MNSYNPLNLSREAKLCGAKLRKKDAFCKNRALLTNGRCRLHGGLTPKGIASPHYKHGRYSKHLPSHLRDRYNDSVNDSELASLRDDLALIDLQISKILEGNPFTSSHISLKTLERRVADARKILAGADLDRREIRRIEAALDGVLSTFCDGNVVSELLPLLELRRKTAESELRRHHYMKTHLSAEDAMAFVSRIADSVKRHITDPKILAAISEDVSKAIR